MCPSARWLQSSTIGFAKTDMRKRPSIRSLLLDRGRPFRTDAPPIVALRSGDKATIEFDRDELEVFKNDLIKLGKEILGRDYESMEPVPKELCGDCDFLSLCRKHPEFDLPEEGVD